MSSWDVAQLTVNLGDHNIKSSSDVRHIEKKVKRIVRHKGFDARTLVSIVVIHKKSNSMYFTLILFIYNHFFEKTFYTNEIEGMT